MFLHAYQTAQRPLISFEVFPPKNDQAREKLDEALPRLIALRPDFFTVTYGALGSTRERTLETAERIHRTSGIPTACHLTCVASSRADLDAILDRIHAAGIRDIMALRGDPPRGEAAEGFRAPEDGCRYANELVAHIHDWERRRGVEAFGIAVAGYPETHVECRDPALDLANLRRKVDAGAHVVITQLFYDNAAYWDFVGRARAAGITVPIVPGLMPILSRKQIQFMTEMCGVSIPADLDARLEQAGDDVDAAVEIGIEHCVAQARELLARGVPGIHFYVLNRADQMERIMQSLPLAAAR